LGRGGKGKSKKSTDWYETKLMIALPSDELLHVPDTGLSKTDIFNFFIKKSRIEEKMASELMDDANAVRNASTKMVERILATGIKNKRIKHRQRYPDETARFGYYYKTIIGEEWIKLKREHRRKEKELLKKRR
jgi:hypothetical protein